MNTDAFTMEDDDTQSYQVSAFNDPDAYNKKIMDEERARQEAADAEHDQMLDEELKDITDHSDAADDEYEEDYDTDSFDTSENDEAPSKPALSSKKDN